MEIRLKIYAFHVMEEEMQYLGLRYMNIKIKIIIKRAVVNFFATALYSKINNKRAISKEKSIRPVTLKKLSSITSFQRHR